MELKENKLFLKVRIALTVVSLILVLSLFVLWTSYFWNGFDWTLMHDKLSHTIWLYLTPIGFGCIISWLITADI